MPENILAEIEIEYRTSEENYNESNENIDFAIDTPPQCLTVPLNSRNFGEYNDLPKAN